MKIVTTEITVTFDNGDKREIKLEGDKWPWVQINWTGGMDRDTRDVIVNTDLNGRQKFSLVAETHPGMPLNGEWDHMGYTLKDDL